MSRDNTSESGWNRANGHKKNRADPVSLCRDDSTRTSDPYVPNVVRYQLRYIPLPIKNKLLSELVDIYLKATLKVCCLVAVDNANLCKFVYHCIDLGSILLGCGFVCDVAQIPDSVSGCLCIILVMQAVTLALTCGTRG